MCLMENYVIETLINVAPPVHIGPVFMRKYPLNGMSRFSPLVGNFINQCIMATGRQRQQGQLRRPTVSN